MRLAYIAAGAAGMYCGSCIHDNTLAAALQRRGLEVALLPTYTPLRTDEEDVSLPRVFYGGINVFLQQKVGLFRHTPWLVDRLLDAPRLLNSLSRFSATTSARDLGALTLSVLQGEEGRQEKELAKLVKWLAEFYKPDLVQLTNSMFVGMARRLKEALDVPVLCSLQGEDLFIEQLVEPYRQEATAVLRERAADLDGFVAPNNYYAAAMSTLLEVPRRQIHVVPLGLNLEGYDAPAAEEGTATGTGAAAETQDAFTIGYLARICPEKGLHLLVDAFLRLRERNRPVRLEVAGYLGRRDRPYFEAQRERLREWESTGDVRHWGEVDREGKISFLNRLDVLSVPTVYREAKGLFVLEALASGVPVVQPDHGSFPELLRQTGGGILVEPASTDALVDGFERLLDDPALRRTLGARGRESVHGSFDDEQMARATVAVYETYLQQSPGRE